MNKKGFLLEHLEAPFTFTCLGPASTLLESSKRFCLDRATKYYKFSLESENEFNERTVQNVAESTMTK